MKLYQVRSRAPTGNVTTTSAVEMPEALRAAAEMTQSGHTDVVVVDLQTGAEAPLDQFKIKRDGDA